MLILHKTKKKAKKIGGTVFDSSQSTALIYALFQPFLCCIKPLAILQAASRHTQTVWHEYD